MGNMIKIDFMFDFGNFDQSTVRQTLCEMIFIFIFMFNLMGAIDWGGNSHNLYRI